MTAVEARAVIAQTDPVLARDLDDAAAVNVARAISDAASSAVWTGALLTALLGGMSWVGVRYGLPAARARGLL